MSFSVAPDLLQREIIERLHSIRLANEDHPKLSYLRSIVAERMLLNKDAMMLTIVLVKSSVSFADVSKAVYGLKISCENKVVCPRRCHILNCSEL